MKKKKIENPWNYRHGQERKEVIDQDSRTIEGEALTIQEIFERSVSGMLPETREGLYFSEDMTHDDEDYEEIAGMEQPDRNALLLETKRKADELTQSRDEQEAAINSSQKTKTKTKNQESTKQEGEAEKEE